LPPDVLAKLSNASAQSVDAVELKLVDGQTIIWGNAGEKELKAKVLAALLKVPVDPKNPVKVYDVSVPRHPVTR
jgi:cell division protein FtsQ